MIRQILAASVLVLSLGFATPFATGQELLPAKVTPEIVNDKPKATVPFAHTWEGAIEEAKLLNVPLVVHIHGFY